MPGARLFEMEHRVFGWPKVIHSTPKQPQTQKGRIDPKNWSEKTVLPMKSAQNTILKNFHRKNIFLRWEKIEPEFFPQDFFPF